MDIGMLLRSTEADLIHFGCLFPVAAFPFNRVLLLCLRSCWTELSVVNYEEATGFILESVLEPPHIEVSCRPSSTLCFELQQDALYPTLR